VFLHPRATNAVTRPTSRATPVRKGRVRAVRSTRCWRSHGRWTAGDVMPNSLLLICSHFFSRLDRVCPPDALMAHSSLTEFSADNRLCFHHTRSQAVLLVAHLSTYPASCSKRRCERTARLVTFPGPLGNMLRSTTFATVPLTVSQALT
jgi:hypothetical protein